MPELLQLDDEALHELEGLCRRGEKAADTEASLLSVEDGWGVSRARWQRRIRFPDDAAARAWNEAWEAMLADPPRTLRPLFDMNGAPIRDPSLRAVTRVAAAVLLDEVRSGMPWPEVRAGWSFELLVAQSWRPSRLPRQDDVLLLLLDAGWRDDHDEPLWFAEALRECPAGLLPRRAPELLLRSARRESEETYTGS